MAFEQTGSIWLNGDLVPWKEANIHVSAHTLHYGSGVFEGIRCYDTSFGPAIFRLEEHVERLFESARVHGLTMPYTRGQIAAAVCDTVSENEFSSCYVRPIVFLGSSTLSLDSRSCPVEVAVLAWPWAALLGDESLQDGVSVTVSPWRKFQSGMMPTTAKACGQYVNSVLAVRDALSRGFDEALLLDAGGSVAEGAGENLFLVRDGVLRTNDERHSILMGITRDAVISIARNLGYTVEAGEIAVNDIAAADEAFFTGTAAEVTPIRELDGVPVGSGTPGPVTRAIQNSFFAATRGRDSRYRHWLHVIEECLRAQAYGGVV